jgi:hypothetical protein
MVGTGNNFDGVYLQHVVIPQRYNTGRRTAPAAQPYRPGETLARCANAALSTTGGTGTGSGFTAATMAMPPQQAFPWFSQDAPCFSEGFCDEVASQASTLRSVNSGSRRSGGGGAPLRATRKPCSSDPGSDLPAKAQSSRTSEPSASDGYAEEERPVGSSSCSTADEEPLPSSNSTTVADTEPLPVDEESAAALSLGSRLLAEVMNKNINNGGEGIPDGISAALTSWAGQLSAGSKDHLKGTCKPCAFAAKGACESGANCSFCHICGPGEKKRRMKARNRRWKGSEWDMPWQVEPQCAP